MRLLGTTKASVAYMLDDLEAEGVIASRLLGRTRRITLNPRYFGAKELRLLLLKLAEGDRAVQTIAASRRGRPRRKGKNL